MRYTTFVLVVAMAGGMALVTGCDDYDSRTIKHEEKVKVDDGKVEKKTETERLNEDGTITKEEKKEVHR